MVRYLFKKRLLENEAFKAEKKISARKSFSSEYHPHYEIYFCKNETEQSVTVNGNTLIACEPNVIISAPFSIHSMTPESPESTDFERYVIFFQGSLLEEYSDELIRSDFFKKYSNYMFKLTHKDADELAKLFDMLLSCDANPRKQMLLFALIIEELCSRVPEDSRLAFGGSEHYIVDVLGYIYDNVGYNITSEIIAAHFHISRAKLDRDFRKFVGLSVHQVIMNCRLNKALDLLSQTRTPVKRVAEICGFENEYYFYAFFKKNMGVTPLSIRKNGEYAVKEDKK